MIYSFTLADAIIIFAYIININADTKNTKAVAVNIIEVIINTLASTIN